MSTIRPVRYAMPWPFSLLPKLLVVAGVARRGGSMFPRERSISCRHALGLPAAMDRHLGLWPTVS